MRLDTSSSCCGPAATQRFACEPVRKDRASDRAEIERLAAAQAPELQAAIEAMLSEQQSGVDLKALIEALKSGSVARVVEVLSAAIDATADAGVQQALLDGAAAAGAATAATIARLTRVEFRFGVLNPNLITWLQGYSLDMIRQVNAATREAIREAAIAGMRAGENPVDTARAIKQVVGLTTRQQRAVANYRKELETFHQRRSAAGWNLGGKIDRVNGRQVFRPDQDGSPLDGIDQRRLRDFRFDGRLMAAMESGKPIPPAKIDEMVGAYARKYLRHRSETIARTEAMRTTNMGVHTAWKQAIESGKADEALVRRLWIVAKDERLCPQCAPVPGLNPKRGVKMGEAFKTPDGHVFLPPLHPSCRCTVSIRLWEPSQLEGEV